MANWGVGVGADRTEEVERMEDGRRESVGEGGEEKEEETKIAGGEKEREAEYSSWEMRVVRRRILVYIAMWETAGRRTPRVSVFFRRRRLDNLILILYQVSRMFVDLD